MDIHQLIAAINPDVFCDATVRRETNGILREALRRNDSTTYLLAAAKARPVEANGIAIERLEPENPFHLPGFKSPKQQHTLIYDSFEESLEAFYFWLLDTLTADEWTVSKLADTFSPTPGSGLFSEMTRRESRAQQEAMRLLRDAHTLVQDILRSATRAGDAREITDINNPRGRTEVEHALLKSKLETLKLYARWLGPYLRQARQLAPRTSGHASLLNLFNTTTAEVILSAQKEYPVNEDVVRGELPKMFLKAKHRNYFSVLIVEFKMRAAPERTTPGAYGYRGRFDLTLTSYALNGDELAVLHRELDRENLVEVIHSLGEASLTTLNNLVKEIDVLVTEPKQSEPVTTDPNPFTALFDFSGWFGGGDRVVDKEAPVALRPDSAIEAVIRSQAILEARRRCVGCYNRCKQVLQMPCL
jgi:hypothetical protein